MAFDRSLILLAALLLTACGGDSDKPRPTPTPTPTPASGWYYTDGSTNPMPMTNPVAIGQYGLNYVTKPMNLRGKTQIRLRFSIDAPLVTKTPPYGPGLATLYFQRRGDNWSAQGKFETYRWWGTFGTITTNGAGEYELVGTINDRWTAIMVSNSVDKREAFLDAWNNAERVGFTLGGGTGYGHGVYGPATLTILEFEVQ